METVRKIVKGYDAVEKTFLVILMGVLVVITFAQVFTRYALAHPLFWSEELAKYIFVWMSWLGVSAGLKSKEHIQVKILPDSLSAKGHLVAEKIVYIIIDVLWFATSIVVVYYGMEIVAMQIETNVFGPSTGIPMWINYLCVPLSGAIVCLRLVGEIVVYTGEIIVLSKKGVQ